MRRIRGGAILAAAFLAGCAGARAHQQGVEEMSKKNLDRAVLDLRRASRAEPANVEYRADLRRAETAAGQRHLDAGDEYLRTRQFDAAVLEFQLALAADPGIQEIATDRVMRAQRQRDAGAALDDARSREAAGDKEGARQAARRAASLDPRNREARDLLERLSPPPGDPLVGLDVPDKPFTLKFSGSHLREAFDVLSQMSGISFVLDDSVKDANVTLYVQDASFATALNLLLTRNQLAAKAMSRDSLLVFPDTREKRKQYRELQVETFYLENMPAADALNLLRGVIDLKGGWVNERLNALVVRDTPEALSVIRRILDANDLERPEVLLDVEMLEIDRQKLLNLGVNLGSYQAGASVSADPANTATALTLDTLLHRFSSRNVLVSLPSAVLSLLQQDTDAKILANPEVRVVDGQQAMVHIGERVPFVTVTTLNTVTSENVQFQDVGIKLTVTPEIHRDDDVTLKLGLEVSSLGPSTSTASGNTVFRIGTRNANTVLTLHDGETQILGGLVQDEERTTLAKIPGLGDLPIVGAIFTNHNRSHVTTDILLSITPRLLRSAPMLAPSEARVWAGQEEDVHPSIRAAAAPSPAIAPAPATGAFALAGPRTSRVAERIPLTLSGTVAGAFRVELRFDPSALELQSLTAGGHAVQPVVDATAGLVTWSAPEGSLPLVATFKSLGPGATKVWFTAEPSSTPGGAPVETTRGETTVLVEP